MRNAAKAMKAPQELRPYFVAYQIGLKKGTELVYATSQTMAFNTQVRFSQGIADYVLLSIHPAYK